MAFYERLKQGLLKTRKSITEKIDRLTASFTSIDDDLFEELEEILVSADVGISTTLSIIEEMKRKVREKKIKDPAEIKTLLKDNLLEILGSGNTKLDLENKPAVIVVIGVNGVGKTTSIGKMAMNLQNSGKKVILAAGDTFRAAALDQLQIWAERAGVEIIKNAEGSDPASVVYDAIQATKARKADVLICDTAGRLHTKKNLMDELKKISNIINRELPQSSRETLLVLDATTGQNAVSQAKTFNECTDISGIILTKLDGTAKGGIIITIKAELDIPVKLIGVGEGIEDLQEFNSEEFLEALLN